MTVASENSPVAFSGSSCLWPYTLKLWLHPETVSWFFPESLCQGRQADADPCLFLSILYHCKVNSQKFSAFEKTWSSTSMWYGLLEGKKTSTGKNVKDIEFWSREGIH
jgi:hypothetical protein